MELVRYEPSGRYPGRIFLLLPAFAGVGVIAGAIYAALVVFIPIVGFVSLVAFAGLAFGLSEVVRRGARVHHSRSRALNRALGAFLGACTMYSSWAFFLFFLSTVHGGELPLLRAFDPGVVVYGISELGATGWQTIKGFTPSGGLLYLAWLLEAVVIVGWPAWLGGQAAEQPYCESCGDWIEASRGVLLFGYNPGVDVDEMIRRWDVGTLLALAPAGTDDLDNWNLIDRIDCPSCDGFTAVGVLKIVWSHDDHGQLQQATERQVEPHLIPPEQLALLEGLVAEREAAAEEAAAAEAVAEAEAGA